MSIDSKTIAANSTTLNNKKRHDVAASLVKGLCIILMVMGHSGVPEWMNHWLGLFRMPSFFFISGYLLPDRNIDNLGFGIKKRFKGLAWVFVKWSLIFLLLHNILYYLHFYSQYYSLNDFIAKAKDIVLLIGSEQLLGGFWFLKELLFASVFTMVVLHLLRKFLPKDRFKQLGLAVIMFFVLSAVIISIIPFKLPYISLRTFPAAAFFMSGYYFKSINFQIKNNLVIGVLFLSIVASVSIWFFGGIGDHHGINVVIYFMVGMIGALGMVFLSRSIPKDNKITKIIDYIGWNTLMILVFHFSMFKIVNAIKVWYYDLDVERIADFPTIDNGNNWHWIIYTIVGVAGSLFMDWLIHGKWKKKS